MRDSWSRVMEVTASGWPSCLQDEGSSFTLLVSDGHHQCSWADVQLLFMFLPLRLACRSCVSSIWVWCRSALNYTIHCSNRVLKNAHLSSFRFSSFESSDSEYFEIEFSSCESRNSEIFSVTLTASIALVCCCCGVWFCCTS